jgi:homoserine dehydrogenase
VSSAISMPTTDLEGHDALDITLVLTSESSAINMPHDAALNTLVQIHDELLKQGDERFPFIQYVTSEDLKAAENDES